MNMGRCPKCDIYLTILAAICREKLSISDHKGLGWALGTYIMGNLRSLETFRGKTTSWLRMIPSSCTGSSVSVKSMPVFIRVNQFMWGWPGGPGTCIAYPSGNALGRGISD